MTFEAQVINGIRQSAPDIAVPPGACDCHVHVFGPAQRFAFSPDRVYTPGDASIQDLMRLQDILRMERVVIVQPSPYGTDNSCTLDALRQIGKRAHGVAVIAPSVTDAELNAMHQAGVRGVRVNLATIGVGDPQQAWPLLRATSERVAALGWHVQIFTNLDVIAALHDRLTELPTALVIDHFGGASAERGLSQPGFAALMSLVRGGTAYVKLSAGYRVSKRSDWADVAPMARALIAANRERIVWGSDWPHPGGQRRSPELRDVIEPFRPIDDGAALNKLRVWAGDDEIVQRILVENPARLYQF